jgi:hypothetical protein
MGGQVARHSGHLLELELELIVDPRPIREIPQTIEGVAALIEPAAPAEAPFERTPARSIGNESEP